jgi:hypothetical protein
MHLLTEKSRQIKIITTTQCRSQWPRGLRHEMFSLGRTLEPWVRIPLEAWMYVCFYSVSG